MRRWKLVISYLRPYWAQFAGGVLALLLGNIGLLGVPEFFARAMDAIETPTRAGLPVDHDVVRSSILIAFGLGVLSAVCTFLKRYLIVGASRRVEADMRRDLFDRIEHLPLKYFDTTRTGDLMSRATADIEAVRMAIGPSIMYFADSILKSVGVVFIMLSIQPELTAWALAPLIGIMFGLIWFAPRIHTAARTVQDGLAAISARSQESFAGGRVVKTFATEAFEQSEMDRLGGTYLSANVHLARTRGAASAWIALMGGASMACILFIGGGLIMDGKFTISRLVQFNSYQMILIWPMIAFGWILAIAQRGAAGADRVKEVLDTNPEEDSGTGTNAVQGALSAKNLTFAYDETGPVLRDVSFDVPAGTTLGIIGPTGSGKSTLLALLARLYEPPRGTLFVDGHDVRDISLDTLRSGIALVPQEAFLYSTSLQKNVTFGRPDATDATWRQAVDDARLSNDLAQLPGGVDTVVGERGVTLSGGQKQRATLARALVMDAPVLVLDDSLSAVDSETETAILDSLRRVRSSRTVIIVAHRISAVRDADQVLVFSADGSIAERGTHNELVKANGEYARIVRIQALEEEIEALE